LYLVVEQPNITQRHAEVNFGTIKEKKQQELMIWHCKLGNPSTRVLEKISNDCEIKLQCTNYFCEAC